MPHAARPYRQRVACLSCSRHRFHPSEACACGEISAVAVRPGPMDRQAVVDDLIAAMQTLNHTIQSGHPVDAQHVHVARVAALLREHEFTVAGVLLR